MQSNPPIKTPGSYPVPANPTPRTYTTKDYTPRPAKGR